MSVAPLRLENNGPGLLFQAQIVGRTVRPPLSIFDFKALLRRSSKNPIYRSSRGAAIAGDCGGPEPETTIGSQRRRIIGSAAPTGFGSAMACAPIATPSASRSDRTEPRPTPASSSPAQGVRELLLVHLRTPRNVRVFLPPRRVRPWSFRGPSRPRADWLSPRRSFRFGAAQVALVLHLAFVISTRRPRAARSRSPVSGS